jgi:hypothetical protein
MSAVAELDISRAIAYTEERRRQSEHDRQAAEMPAVAMAEWIASGLCGVTLSNALHTHFPDARRADVYLGIALGVAWLQAEVTIARMETALLRQEGTAA